MLRACSVKYQSSWFTGMKYDNTFYQILLQFKLVFWYHCSPYEGHKVTPIRNVIINILSHVIGLFQQINKYT
jgi:hypothetical protein